MCGITGVFGDSREALAPLASMTAAIRHRGPDDEGYVLANTRSGRIEAFCGADTVEGIRLPRLPDRCPEGFDLGLGHRRLSIIDLSPAGHGPMSSADGALWVTYNGEVYNYLELRSELASLGHAFRSASDTEVLLAAYAEWGPAALDRLNGMWAFGLYDSRQARLFCARDRFGVKPFHYYWDGSLFAFASEIKALLAHPAIPCEPDEPTLHSFLVHGRVDEGEQTFFRGICSLQPGHTLSLDLRTRNVRIDRWYLLPTSEDREGDPAELRALLEDSVRLRLRSDVDVGSCLSGGLDSSSVVALTARLRESAAAGRHRAFSVVYEDPALNESRHIESVVRHTGVEGARTTPSSAEMIRDLPKLAQDQDEPFPSAGPYSQWRVMKLAREARVKVLLDGQGADEILGGYHYHFGPQLAEIAQRQSLMRALREAHRAHQVTGLSLPLLLGLMLYHRLPAPRSLRSWAVSRWASHGRVPAELVDPAFAGQASATPSERHLPRSRLAAERRAAVEKTSLPALLRYEDRSSMAFGIEARTPYLDYRLVEYALSLRACDLIRDGWTKVILREAVAGVVPDSVRLRRDKLGFATPETRWLHEVAPTVREWLGPGSHITQRLERDRLRRWLACSDAALASRPGLWRLVSAELWLRHVAAARHGSRSSST